MPRGKYTNHKGRSRRFTSAEELEEQRKKDEYRQKKRERGMESSEEEEEEEKEKASDEEGGSDSEESEGEDANKNKGVASLIEIQNPNRAPPKAKKATAISEDAKPELSRREREEIEKQRASAHYHMLHAQGKTAQARADLARLAIIKQQREDAAKRREAEKAEREAAKKDKTALTQKALGKKT